MTKKRVVSFLRGLIIGMVLTKVLILLSSCVNVEQAPLDSKGNMACFLGSTLVFQGTLDLRGSGAYSGGESIFTGEWQLCQPQKLQVRCIVQVIEKDGGVK